MSAVTGDLQADLAKLQVRIKHCRNRCALHACAVVRFAQASEKLEPSLLFGPHL
jgi:hypothetical protein